MKGCLLSMKSKLFLVTAFLLLLITSADAQSFREKLLAINGVISVEEIEQDEKVFEEKYILRLSSLSTGQTLNQKCSRKGSRSAISQTTARISSTYQATC